MASVAVCDASVLIGHLDTHDAHHAEATRLLHQQVGTFAAAALTIAEVLVAPARTGRLAAARAALAALEIRQIDTAADAPARLAVLRAQTGLRMPDCCVLLAAEDAAAEHVLTLDQQLAREAVALGYGVPAGGGV